MSRQNVIRITIGFLVVAAIALLAWWIAYGRPGEGARNVPSSPEGYDFFPITGAPSFPPTGTGTEAIPTPGGRLPVLRQISETPTSGVVAFRRADTGTRAGQQTTFFRWVERATGHIFEMRADGSGKTRISNTTLPGIQEALFSGDGDRVLLRYVAADDQTIETVLGQLRPVTATTSDGRIYSDTRLVTTFLPRNIAQVAPSPDGQSFAELLEGLVGSVRVASFADGSSAPLFESPISEWNLGWPGADEISLTTRGSHGEPGYLYLVNRQSGASEKVLERIPGLSALVNPAGTRVLYSASIGGDLSLSVLDVETGISAPLEIRGLPDKCAWSRTAESVVYCGQPDEYYRGEYPDNWYRGQVSFVDNIWRIDVDRGTYRFLHDVRVDPIQLDVWRPYVSADDEYLLFTNKSDLTLWSLNLRGR